MSDFLNAVWLDEPYPLSLENEELKVVIPKNVLKLCGKQDMFVLDFLHRSYRKELNGVILNVEDDLNPELQVSTYLGALNKALDSKFLALILCPDEAIIKWHYYMSHCGSFNIELVAPETSPHEIKDASGTILLVSFSHIKLVESLVEFDFHSVVIDRFDRVATKLIIRKLQSNFNIGITYRNFYTQPDQKLQWTMLNWSNPGCVGKLIDFYQADNDNFVNFRDAYKEWWFRITWNYCDSFVKPSLAEKGDLNVKLRDWAKGHNNLFKYCSLKQNERKRTRRTKDDSNTKPNRAYNKSVKKIRYIKNEINSAETKQNVSNSSDSSDTIIYGDLQHSPKALLEEDGCDFKDNASTSSNEQLLFSSIINNTSSELQSKDMEDESDVFLKSVATKDDFLIEKIKLTEQWLTEASPKSKNLPSTSRHSMDIISEDSDNFLKDIICNAKEVGNNYTCTSITISEVDSLVAEVMEMVRN